MYITHHMRSKEECQGGLCNLLIYGRVHADVDVMAQGSQCKRISVYCVRVHVCLACSRTLTSLRTRLGSKLGQIQVKAGSDPNLLDRGQSRKMRFSKLPGSGLKKFSVNSVFCFFFFPRKTSDKMLPKSCLVNQFSATPWGQLNWTGPNANGSDQKGVKVGSG